MATPPEECRPSVLLAGDNDESLTPLAARAQPSLTLRDRKSFDSQGKTQFGQLILIRGDLE